MEAMSRRITAAKQQVRTIRTIKGQFWNPPN